MFNSLLAEHLKTLHRDELERFEQFLASPYCNTFPHPDQQIRLVRRLFQLFEEGSPEQASVDSLQSHVFGSGNIPAGKLDKLMSATLQTLKQFLADHQRRKKSDLADEQLWLAAFYRERGLDRRFEKLVDTLDQQLTGRSFSGELWADSRLRLEEERMRYSAMQSKPERDMNLVAAIRAIDEAWLLRRLLYLMTLLHLKHVRPGINNDALYDWFEPLVPYFEREFAAVNPVLKTYLLSVRLATANTPEAGDEMLKQLLDMLDTIRHTMPTEHLAALEQHALHYCHRQAFLGRDFAGQVFRIFQSQAAGGRILLQGKINYTVFISAVVAGLRAGQDVWVESFIETYHPFISGAPSPADVHRLGLARLYFHRRQYDRALDHTSGYFENLELKIFARAFELQILYELDSPLFDSRLEAFKLFIFREKDISPEKKETYNRFVNILMQMRTPSNRENPARKAKLAGKVREAPSIAERFWLLDKLR